MPTQYGRRHYSDLLKFPERIYTLAPETVSMSIELYTGKASKSIKKKGSIPLFLGKVDVGEYIYAY